MLDHFHAVDVRKPGAQFLMKCVQREFIHGDNLARPRTDGTEKFLPAAGQASSRPLEFGHYETYSRRPPVHRWSDGTRHIAQ
jgi:hypothetical protein